MPLRLLLILLLPLGLLLNACAPSGVRAPTPTATPDILLLTPDPAARLEELEQLAAAAPTAGKKAYYTLLAIELLMAQDKIEEVEKRLAGADLQALDQQYAYRLELLDAQLALAHDNAPLSLQKLPQHNSAYPLPIQIAILDTRAEALAMLGYLSDSLNIRLQLDRTLQKAVPDKPQIAQPNQLAIWSLLQAMPPDMLNALDRKDPVLNGWVDLSQRVRAARQSGTPIGAAITAWTAKYKNHPAGKTLTQALQTQIDLVTPHPRQLALVLPLSGRLAPPAKAILNGFLAGYFSHDAATRPSIRVYDSGEDPKQIWPHYQQAVQDGAQLIIGPLEKAAVNELLSVSRLQVPVLALNYGDDPQAFSRYVLQFGLLPEDEARQAAELAIIKNQMNAIVFAPDNALGKRLGDTFVARYTELGGTILGVEKYAAGANDHSDPIQHALKINQSKNRNSILKSVLQRDLKFEPRRRSDAEAIFLVADPAQTRNFRSQLKFFDSGDIAVYATSMSYSGIADKPDKDMDGVVFTDMPWTFQGKRNRQFAAALENWPQEMQRYSRLYALGLDAYHIIPYLKLLQQYTYERFSGLTGNISMNGHNQIHRELTWGVFTKGNPELLEFKNLQEYNLFELEDELAPTAESTTE
ncbi:MAG TPA: penicillin-binding protein activator [Gammaproteobacteria bacterium]|nr:penicillin-binding protein activator [Gammaproteobacteria bacterium]